MSDDIGSRSLMRFRLLLDRLKSSTILATTPSPHSLIPEVIIKFMRTLSAGIDPKTDEDPENPQNPYKWAHRRVSRLWGSDKPDPPDKDATQVSKFNTVGKLLTSYWTSEHWKKAWGQTGIVVGLSALMAQDIVWLSQSGAELINGFSTFKANSPDSISGIFTSAAKLGGYGLLMSAINDRLYYFKMAMRRDMTHWMSNEFMEAVFKDRDGVQRYTHNQDHKSESPDVMPINPHQTIGNSVGQMNNLITYVGAETISITMITLFVTHALYQKSVPIEFLEAFATQLNNLFPEGSVDLRLGDKGTFAMALASSLGFLALTIPKAKDICKKLEESYSKTMDLSGQLTSHLVHTFSRGDAIAASNGHVHAQENTSAILDEIRESTKNDDVAFRKYMAFSGVQNLLGEKIISIIPGAAGLLSGKLSFQGFLETQGLVIGSFLALNHYMMQVFPSLSRISTFSNQLVAMAQMIEKTKNKKEFYSLTGIHEFDYQATLPSEGQHALQIENLELFHAGTNPEAFLRIPSLEVEKGTWVMVQGHSRSGKSCLFKAISNLWPYGRGTIQLPQESKIFYARQDPDIDKNLTLAEQVLYGQKSLAVNFHQASAAPAPEKCATLRKVEWALATAGLGELTEYMLSKSRNGKAWPDIFSGGQKHRLVLARILYQQPEFLLLDEATSALDPAAKQEFFAILKEHIPEVTIIAVIHDKDVPIDTDKKPYFNQILKIENGTGTMQDIPMASNQNLVALESPANSFVAPFLSVNLH